MIGSSPAHRLKAILPDAGTLLMLTPEELGWLVLSALKEELSRSGRPHVAWGYYEVSSGGYWEEGYGVDANAVRYAFMEALAWLNRMGFIARAPDDPGPARPAAFFVTRQGQQVGTKEEFQTYLKAARFPREYHHPAVVQAAWPDFMAGEYDTAVLKAFRQIEVRLRDHTGIGDTNVKVEALTIEAFKKGGLLRLPKAMEAQKDLRRLLVEAMGYFRNPTAHNSVSMPIEEAIEAIGHASFLRRYLD